MLNHIGEPSHPPPTAPISGSPTWHDAPEPMPGSDLFGQPEPDVG